MPNPNFIFFGTPDVASETLEILKHAGFLPSLIITSPDKPQGRKMILTPSPVKVWAQENKIPFLQPEKIDNEFLEKLKPSCLESNCLFIVAAYGKILPEEILNLPRLGSINVHYSLLPKYRGASPVETAILNADTETGVSIQKMVYALDAGDVLIQEKVAIRPDETAPELRKRLIKLGGEMLVKMLSTSSNFDNGEKQEEALATYSKKIKKEDGLVNLETEFPSVLYNKFRAYAHWPRTFFFKDGKRIIITDATLEDDPLDPARGKKFIIKRIIPEGGKEADWKN